MKVPLKQLNKIINKEDKMQNKPQLPVFFLFYFSAIIQNISQACHFKAELQCYQVILQQAQAVFFVFFCFCF